MRAALVLAIVAALGGVAHAQFAQGEPQARLQLQSRDTYANMPFGVLVVAEGFDADPAPAQPTLVVDGCKVTPVGVEPNINRISFDGQVIEQVTWVFRWRVEAPKAGTYTVQPVTVVQGAKQAVAAGGNLPVIEIETTDDMKLQVNVPDRPVWLGEVVPIEIDWLLRKDVADQDLSVPLLTMPDDFAVSAPPPVADARQVLPFPAGATELQLPYVTEAIDGYTRYRFTVLVTPLRAGTVEVPGAQVVASLKIGTGRDRFGFATARTQLFRAADIARTIEVKPLPQQGRPASFAGAVGSSFSIAARLSRSVVQLGEPVDLELTVVGDIRLDGLSLGSLAGAGRLSADRFAMPDTVPPGVLSDDGKTKVFTVAVQVTDPATTEIPPIELAWFDPAAGAYHTAKSDPIALSVKGGTVVGAADVKGGARKPAEAAPNPDDVSLVGADLALSAPGAALDRPLGGGLLWALVLALYLVPLGVFGLRVWQLRTAGRRESQGEVAAARKKVEAALALAATAPGRDSAAPLGTALRSLRKLLAQTGGDDVLARIETEGFARDAGAAPLSAPLRADAAALVKQWLDAPRARKLPAAVALVLLLGIGARTARADDVEDGRSAYSEAMAAVDPTLRQQAFARAAAAFAAAAEAHPGSPELLADWGNAALGAADFGAATLAYRRALRIDGDHTRARKNLAWLRARLPANLAPHEGGAASTLFFFHDRWQRSTRLLVGAGAFAIMALLLVPWRRRPGGGRLALAAVPAVVWILMSGSVLLQRDAGADGVVLESQILRSADNAGAPAAEATPLPPGVEVTIVERRPGWARVRTPGGTTGWLPGTSVEAVVE